MSLPDADQRAALDDAVSSFTALDRAVATAAVPACPDWAVADLLTHVGRVHRWAAEIITTDPERRPVRPDGPLPDGTDPWAFLSEGADILRRALDGADLDAARWTFRGPMTVRWWLRRQVHETTVHALDALDARDAMAGESGPPAGWQPAPAVAVDGIDELFEVFLPRLDAAGVAAGGEPTVHLHATDTAGEWLLRFSPSGVTVTREHAKGDVAARGPAHALLRLVWGRPDRGELDVFGDRALLDRYRVAGRF